MSRNTLREALRGLAEQGLVTHRPHHGVVVTDLDEADVADLYGLRRVLETAGLPAVAGDADRLDLLLACGPGSSATRSNGTITSLRSSTTSPSTGRSSPRSAAGESTTVYARAQAELRPVLLQLDAAYEDPTQVAEHLRLHQALRRGDLPRRPPARPPPREGANSRTRVDAAEVRAAA